MTGALTGVVDAGGGDELVVGELTDRLETGGLVLAVTGAVTGILARGNRVVFNSARICNRELGIIEVGTTRSAAALGSRDTLIPRAEFDFAVTGDSRVVDRVAGLAEPYS